MELKFKVKKPVKKAELTKKYRSYRTAKTLRWIQRKYLTGDLDLTKKSHVIAARIAAAKGLIPKEVLKDGRYYQTDDHES